MGSSGNVELSSGDALGGSAGEITAGAGNGGFGDGGTVLFAAGGTTAGASSGGKLSIYAGQGEDSSSGSGGNIDILGGEGLGALRDFGRRERQKHHLYLGRGLSLFVSYIRGGRARQAHAFV